MDITIFPKKLSGQIDAVASKSHAHRIFLCSALADKPAYVEIQTISGDLAATIGCITSFGAEIEHHYGQAEIIKPIQHIPSTAICNCGESGSTLRFMLPLAGSLGIDTLFLLEGRLPYRPLSPLWEEMERHGCQLSWINPNEMLAQNIPISRSVTAGLQLKGKLRPGHYRMDGNVSSQFISGLLMALPLLEDASELDLMSAVESRPYIDLTLETLRKFDIHWVGSHTSGRQQFKSPGTIRVESDWSNAAFWLTADALGSQVTVHGLSPDSLQGDKAILHLLKKLQNHCCISAADIPDLVPVLAVFASANQGAVITDIRRLRLKESDRVFSTLEMIRGLGGNATADENTMTIFPSTLIGGTVDSHCDHRIAMAAAIASTVCTKPVTILGAECVRKSYPNFWKEFTRLGGNI